MSKPKRLGLVVLIFGGTLGLVLGRPAGLVFAAAGLVVGLVLFVLAEAQGTPGTTQTSHPAQKKTQLLVLLKEVHARPQRGGKFQEIHDPSERGFEFEVFINCWLLNETELPFQIAEEPQLTLRAWDGSIRIGERINSDLENWRLGSLVKDEWDAEVVRTAQERILELSTGGPLECGVPRQGWLHFRLRDLSASEFNTGAMELSIKDSFSCIHMGVASGPRHLPGRVWPFVASRESVEQIERG
jgi:hypothetical protein